MEQESNLGEQIPVQEERAHVDSGRNVLTNFGNAEQAQEYKRSKQSLLREYEITIRFLSVGCVVRVGCKEIAFEDLNRAMEEVNDYVRDPHTSIDRWNKIFNQ